MKRINDPNSDTVARHSYQPKWGVKKNSDGKNTFWFGFKAHLAVSTKSQYIVAGLMSSGNLSDSKAAIPLLKKVAEVVPHQFTTAIFDAGYDYTAIYRQISDQDMKAVIPYVKRRETKRKSHPKINLRNIFKKRNKFLDKTNSIS